MFFRYHTDPGRLSKLFARYRAEALRLDRYRKAYGTLWLVLALAYAAVAYDAIQQDPAALHVDVFQAVLIGGIGFLLVGWLIAAGWGAYPYQVRAPGSRVAHVIAIVIISVISVAVSAESWTRILAAPPRTTDHWIDLAEPLLWAAAGLYLLSRLIVWWRMRAFALSPFELDYLAAVLQPLLHDLPAKASCSLLCNPFSPVWTARPERDEHRTGYVYFLADDILLDFTARIDDRIEFRLKTMHRRIDKYKTRGGKIKYKGSKHRIAQTCSLQQDELGRLTDADLEALRALTARRDQADAGFVGEVRDERRDGRLVVAHKKKFIANRDLAAGDLPSTELTVRSIRALSALASGSAQRPA